jgi:hypothetical protein
MIRYLFYIKSIIFFIFLALLFFLFLCRKLFLKPVFFKGFTPDFAALERLDARLCHADIHCYRYMGHEFFCSEWFGSGVSRPWRFRGMILLGTKRKLSCPDILIIPEEFSPIFFLVVFGEKQAHGAGGCIIVSSSGNIPQEASFACAGYHAICEVSDGVLYTYFVMKKNVSVSDIQVAISVSGKIHDLLICAG